MRSETISLIDDGISIEKVSHCRHSKDDVVMYTDRLRQAGCITYDYHFLNVDEQKKIIHFKRDKVIGTQLHSLYEYPNELFKTWGRFVDHYVNAGDCFDDHGVGFLPYEPCELHNVLLRADGGIELIDVETAFLRTTDRRLFFQYRELIRSQLFSELMRFDLVQRILYGCA